MKLTDKIEVSTGDNIKLKPKTEIVSENNYMRFNALYKCYCPRCNKLLKRKYDKCFCGQSIDWSEWE